MSHPEQPGAVPGEPSVPPPLAPPPGDLTAPGATPPGFVPGPSAPAAPPSHDYAQPGHTPPGSPAAAPYGGAQAGYPVSNAPAAASPPGTGLSIAAIVLAFLIPPVGAILGFVASSKLKKAGAGRGLAIAAIIIGIVFTIGWIIGAVAFVSVIGSLIGTCAQLGPGVWEVNGVTYTCG